MIVVLCGYMGSGKTLIGSKLAKELGFYFQDLDQKISAEQGMTIPEIFEHKGEIFFRKAEISALKNCLEEKKNLVLALGGGTPCYGDNLKLIQNNPDTIMVYLKVKLPMLSERLFKEREKRPLLSQIEDPQDMFDFVRKHLFERQFYYLQSHFNVEVSEKKPQEIVTFIAQKVWDY